MQKLIIYKAVHDETGEVLTGTAKQIAEKLGVVPTTVNKTAIQGSKLKGHWELAKVNQEDADVWEYKFPRELLDAWDEVTKPFKAASIRKRGLLKG